jgi:hypothetical protein
VVERLAPVACGVDEDLELTAHLFLADVFGQVPGSQRPLDRLLLR